MYVPSVSLSSLYDGIDYLFIGRYACSNLHIKESDDVFNRCMDLDKENKYLRSQSG
jgi:hypothetical protein